MQKGIIINKVLVLNRNQIEQYTQKEDTLKKAVVCITNSYGSSMIIDSNSDNIIDVMCLYFDNADIGENAMTEYDAM